VEATSVMIKVVIYKKAHMLFPVPAFGAGSGMLVAILVLVGIVLSTAAWVYKDAKASAGRGRPIVSSVGSLQLGTPISWFFACLLLWELCFPLYIDSRTSF
jgi:ABC-type amino acid transport system permease subunit